MRVAVIGQGSIGRRHAAILLELGHEVAVYDPSPAVQSPPGVLVTATARECLQGADAAVVASPSNEHPADARAAIELGVPVLVEKPLALDSAHATELDCLAREREVMLSVAMNLREHPGVRALAALLAEGAVGRILRASAWCGSWLPGWRADSDYRHSYSARAALGGGVLLDVAIHELDYLLWLTGPVRSVSAVARHVSDLETDVEDVALIAMELASGGLAEIVVDYFDRSYTRGCRIVGSDATLHWSWEQERLTRDGGAGGCQEQRIASDISPTYVRELERFLAAIAQGADAPVPAADARQVLAVLDAARTSAREERTVRLAPTPALRAATVADEERLLAWRNDPETRRWSRQQEEVTADDHRHWLQRTLGDPSTSLMIAELDGVPVGQVRVSQDTPMCAELHITVAPEARGRGLASTMLIEAAARALAEPKTERLIAYVKPDNNPSLRAFEHAGLDVCGADSEGLLCLERCVAARG